ncbi:MAG TPA: hypothetical protein VE869_16945 [Gemmatimonas sp.]|nr:hypothetical protein [Gemmatimonas sp.]
MPAPMQQDSAPLDPWMLALVHDAMTVESETIPREMMWSRIRQQRAAASSHVAAESSGARDVGVLPVQRARSTPKVRTAIAGILAIAATLLVGIGIGRNGADVNSNSNDGTNAVAAASGTTAGSTAAALASRASDPAVLAMEEHLAHSVALLVTVRDEKLDAGLAGDVSGWARELLGTTRLLLDEPQLRDDRTRRLLNDLELVLVQIVQARSTTAPEARRAPSETMRETNLLPRVRAVVTASRYTDESSLRGIAE